jgi:hypothetical protein
MCSGVQGLYAVTGRESLLKEEASDHVGGGANDAFDPTVLGRGVRARDTQLNAVGEGGARCIVVELAAVIRLKGTNWVETQAKKWVRVANVSNFSRRGKVQRK